MERIICLAIGYVCGLLQSGYLVGKLHHIDIRKSGSGNAGSTNALRVMGWKAGLMTFAGDVLKCFAAVLIVRGLYHGSNCLALLMMYAGAGVTLGHNFPFYMKFKGGKGIAVSFGVLLALFPIWKPVLLLAFFYILFSVVFKIRSHRRRSIVTFGCFCVGCLSLVPIPAILLGCVLISCIVIYKHHLMEEKSNESANLIL